MKLNEAWNAAKVEAATRNTRLFVWGKDDGTFSVFSAPPVDGRNFIVVEPDVMNLVRF